MWASRLKLARLVLRHRGILCRSRCSRRLKDPPQVPHAPAGGLRKTTTASARSFPIGPVQPISLYKLVTCPSVRCNACIAHIPKKPMHGLTPIATALLLICVLPSSLVCAKLAKGTSSQPLHKKTAHTALSEFSLGCPLKFITGICTDGPHHIWVSGEDNGLFAGKIKYRHLPASAFHREPTLATHNLSILWYHFDKTNSPGLASNFITAICVDGQGRLWAGTDRHGVCVFNGKHWKHYSILNGPLGCHVYAIAYDRYARQVWIATENGISIYQCSTRGIAAAGLGSRHIHVPLDRQSASASETPQPGTHNPHPAPAFRPHTWHYITTANGCHPDCMAFDNRGTAYVGTLCNGLAIGRPIMKYPGPPGAMFARRKLQFHWRIITGPWHMPITATGYGLPSNLINCVLVGQRRGHIYVGTDLGLAISTNRGQSFHYIRGSDYAAKVMGLWHPPAGYHPPPQAFLNKLLPGDHITTLAQDPRGDIWVGTWRNGYAVISAKTGQMIKSEDEPQLKAEDGYINRLCPLVMEAVAKPGRQAKGWNSSQLNNPEKVLSTMLIGRYGFGVHCFAGGIKGQAPPAALVALNPTESTLPAFAKPPTVHELNKMLRLIKAHRLDSNRPIYLGCDWATRGDEVDHYGRQCGILCASGGIGDNYLAMSNGIAVAPMQGPHARRGDGLRRWVQWLTTDNPNSLYAPWQGSRIQSSWDDHGEAYANTFDGPNIDVAFHLPSPHAIYRISLYFFNKDGHDGSNRQRDYVIEIYRLARRYWSYLTPPPGGFPTFPGDTVAKRWMTMAGQAQPLAEARVVNFWGGVYERFRLSGPGDYMLCIRRNYSLNTILSGFFIDRITGKSPQPGVMSVWGFSAGAYGPPKAIPSAPGASPTGDARAVWHKARSSLRYPALAVTSELLAYRAAYRAHAPRQLLRRWRWFLHLWTSGDRARFDDAIRKAYTGYLARQAESAAYLRALHAALKAGHKHFTWRGPHAPPATKDKNPDKRRS